MACLISLEDHKGTATRLLGLCKERVPNIGTKWINYKDPQGVPRNPSDIAKEASACVNEPTAFLLDLVSHKGETDISYGLDVIQEITGQLIQNGSGILDFLKRKDMLVCIVTNFPPREKDMGEIAKFLGVQNSTFKIKNIENNSDIQSILRERRKKAILTIIRKISRENLVPELVAEWINTL